MTDGGRSVLIAAFPGSNVAKIRTYQCPGRDGQPHTFDFLHHPSDEPPPRFCPKCGLDSQADDFDQAVTAPHVLAGRAKNITVAADQTYRGMEAAGEANMRAAAEHLGVPDSEMADLKITNLSDYQREGDIAAKIPVNPVSTMVAQAPTLLGNQGAEVGRFFADSTPKTGPEARMGSRARQSLGDFHTKFSPAAVAASEKGRY